MFARVLAAASIIALCSIGSAQEIPNLSVLELKGGAEGTRPYGLTPFRGKLLFCGEETSSTVRLWSTDGTFSGTVPISREAVDFHAVQRIDRGVFYPLGNQLLTFVHGKPWITDGTAEGTHELATNLEFAGPGQPYLPAGFAMLNGYAYIAGKLDTSSNFELVRAQAPFTRWEEVGSLNATVNNVGTVLVHGPYVYFTSGSDLHRVNTDGAVVDYPGIAGDGRTTATTPGELVFFSTENPVFHSPFGLARAFDRLGAASTGTSERCLDSVMVYTGKPQPSDYQIGIDTGSSWVRASGNTWPTPACDRQPCTDCLPGGYLISSSAFTSARNYPFGFKLAADFFTRVGNRVLFAGDWDSSTGVELIATDGTAVGTHLAADIKLGAEGSVLRSFKAIGNKLLFEATDGVSGMEPWISDGTAEGTLRIADLAPGADSSEDPAIGTAHRLREFAVANGRLFITAHTAETGMELWVVPAGPLGLDSSASTDLFDPILERYDASNTQIADANGDSVVDAADVQWVASR